MNLALKCSENKKYRRHSQRLKNEKKKQNPALKGCLSSAQQTIKTTLKTTTTTQQEQQGHPPRRGGRFRTRGTKSPTTDQEEHGTSSLKRSKSGPNSLPPIQKNSRISFISLSLVIFVIGYLSSDLSRSSSNGFI